MLQYIAHIQQSMLAKQKTKAAIISKYTDYTIANHYIDDINRWF